MSRYSLHFTTKNKQDKTILSRWFYLITVVLALSLPCFTAAPSPLPAYAAQSTRDVLPTPTSTPQPLPTVTPVSTLTPTPASKVWVGRLVSNTLGYTKGGGSIFRVYVTGVSNTRIELHSDDELIAADSGSKPEHGPYAAEFAPVTAGMWTVSVPAVGASMQLMADGYNFAVIEFLQVPAPEATQAVLPTPTPTPLGGQIWEGRVAAEKWGIGASFSRLLVQVVGRSDQPVRLSTLAQVINTANTGQKPDELGPDVVEFTALTPAKYIIEPLGLNVRFEVELKTNTETRVEFRPIELPPTATFTPIPPPPTITPPPAPPTALPTSTLTPIPTDTATPTVTPTPTSTTTPLPSPTPVTRWLGAITDRIITGTELTTMTVKVSGIEGLPVQLRGTGSTFGMERRCITGQGALAERDTCAYAGIKPGQYMIAPEGFGLSLPVTVYENEAIMAVFDLEVLPPGVTGWQVRLTRNSNSPQATSKIDSTITVRLVGRNGQVVALRSARGTEQFCEVRSNPIVGGLACEFGQLAPGVYLIEALHTGAGLRLFVDGEGAAEVEFSPNATYATLALAQSPPIIGQGAQPRRPATATATATPVPVAVIRPTFTITPVPSPTATSTPTPAFAWQGRIVSTQDGVVGTIAVRAAGLKDHPVIIHSGPWQSQPQLTGTKPELGEYATEFGGLATGEYIIELVDLAKFKVNLGPGQFMLVEFRYDLVNPP